MTSNHLTSQFYLNGLKSKPPKVLNYDNSVSAIEDISRLKANTNFFKIVGNNNMDLYRKYVEKTVEATKYFNYYKPDTQGIKRPNILNYNLTTVEGLEKKYDLEDGFIL
jgi:hypothetical protein